jgi:hemolysin activation/secretion protein
MAKVRGYTENLLIGDSGWFASAECQVPLDPRPGSPAAGPSGFQARGCALLDGRAAYPYRTNGGTNGDDYLYSVGVGAQANLPIGLLARLVVGVPLTHPAGDDQAVKLLFYVQATI